MITLSFVQTITNIIFTVVEFFIGSRVLLQLAGANAQTPFVSWIYSTSSIILAPFAGIFPAQRIQGAVIVDFTGLFGLFVYLLIYYGITELIRYSARSTTSSIKDEADYELEHHRREHHHAPRPGIFAQRH